MTKTRVVDNSERPAQPEPGEDPATNSPDVREQARLVEPRPRPRDIVKADEREKAAEEREERSE